jgi:hypothetical protein
MRALRSPRQVSASRPDPPLRRQRERAGDSAGTDSCLPKAERELDGALRRSFPWHGEVVSDRAGVAEAGMVGGCPPTPARPLHRHQEQCRAGLRQGAPSGGTASWAFGCPRGSLCRGKPGPGRDRGVAPRSQRHRRERVTVAPASLLPTDQGTLGAATHSPARQLGWSHRRPRRQYQRLPACDCPGTCPGMLGIGDAGEQPAQLDRCGELPALIEGRADCRGVFLGDDERAREHGEAARARQAGTGRRRAAGSAPGSGASESVQT